MCFYDMLANLIRSVCYTVKSYQDFHNHLRYLYDGETLHSAIPQHSHGMTAVIYRGIFTVKITVKVMQLVTSDSLQI